ncbi:glycosyltransferase WbsX family protein [Enterococcus avium]|uniref:glycosyltransferase WbsX family protein n=1 Tax=Enterococcus avium TaxID=33945 RepID=UPI0028912033|nr:glycoside hydrolase family 99-like domain-containing protein [Enterococcus avium]MDT2565988.1 glycoside hydrolase family 99-like domain-containing protein [Enterococcus avium]
MKKVKVLAFHLPQFHSFKENDEWWGKGFTEWTNTRKAKMIYPEHNQPREPENDYYYDLTDTNAMKWQMDIAKANGIYGFCYYHYWFDGKLLLEKPLEKMLEMQEERLPYCFCWANEPWTRIWEGNSKEVLMPQNYGKKEDWEKHYQYLKQFFLDDYYIKVENKPMLIFYRTNSIPNFDEMIRYFDHCCKQDGFSGIYSIEELNSFQSHEVSSQTDAILEFEPMYTMIHKRSFPEKVYDKLESLIFNLKYNGNLMIYNYDRLWKRILKRKRKGNKKIFFGAFVDWDNTARKGKRGRIVRGVTPEKFKKYFSKQLELSSEEGNEFIFVNAWNEWGEGTYLEPDKKNGKKFLEAIKSTLSEND